MKKPDFLIIGAARSGTTFLFNLLQYHNHIYLPAQKRPEPHFFLKDKEYLKGHRYYLEKYFQKALEKQVAGECSTSYLFSEMASKRIYEYLPNVKLLVCLRNPLDRAYSNYKVSKMNGFEDLSFEKAIEREIGGERTYESKELAEIAPNSYLYRGLYYKQISFYLKFFKKSHMQYIFFDELIEKPIHVVNRVCSLLGVSNFKTLPFVDRIDKNQSKDKSSYSNIAKEAMTSFFRDDINELSKLLKVNLDNWLY